MEPDVEWSVREKLSIGSYVLHSSNQHWSSGVSRMLRPLGEPDRPSDWFSPKNCAQQYTALVEVAETPRRKRGERSESSESVSCANSPSTLSVGEMIVQKLTQERSEELKKLIRAERAKYKKIKQTLEQLEAGELDDKLDEMIEDIERKEKSIQLQKIKQEEAGDRQIVPSSEESSPMVVSKEQQSDVAEPSQPQASDDMVKSAKVPNFSEAVEVLNSTEAMEIPDTTEVEETVASEEKMDVEEIPEQTESTPSVSDVVTADDSQIATNVELEPTSVPQAEEKNDEQPALEESAPETVEVSQPEVAIDESDRTDPDVKDSEIQPLEEDYSILEELSSLVKPEEVGFSENLEEDVLENHEVQPAVEDGAVKTNTTDAKAEETPSDEIPAKTAESSDTQSVDVTEPVLESATSEQTVDDIDEVETVPAEEQNEVTDAQDSADALPAALDDKPSEELKETAAPDQTDESVKSEDLVEVSEAVKDDTEFLSTELETSMDAHPEQVTEESMATSSEVEETGDVLRASDAGENIEQNEGDTASVSSMPAYVDSFPSSPALSHASDLDPEATASYRAWKKSIIILWKQVASHRYASLFLQPVTDDIAPNYSNIVYRPMDLSTLKKNLETGAVRTTNEFQRDLMLMFQNALMYNNHEHDVYKMALEMQKDVMDQVAQFLATQLMMETAQQGTPKGLRRSTLRKSAMSEKVNEARSKRSAAIEGEMKLLKKKSHD